MAILEDVVGCVNHKSAANRVAI